MTLRDYRITSSYGNVALLYGNSPHEIIDQIYINFIYVFTVLSNIARFFY